MLRYIIIILLAISSAAWGQQVLEGKVIDKETQKPVPFASIGIIGLPRGTSSNIDGEFSLPIPSSPFTLKVTCLGYESAVLHSVDKMELIELKPVATQLDEIVILYREVNPRKIVRKAFSRIRDNYDDKSFLQKFFYRQYSKSDSLYERLIEASVDVWKENGYRSARKAAGENEAFRINQLRRSLDIKGMVQGQTPIYLQSILQTDIVGYQSLQPLEHLKVFDEVSNLKTDFDRYQFSFKGITTYDGQEVYKIQYESQADSILTTSGYIRGAIAKGTLYITTDTYAFVKTEEIREDGINTYSNSSYYLKHQEKYYPYHLVREGENHFINSSSFHIELMAVEISHDENDRFQGDQFTRSTLLNIAYDSSFWSTSTVLKTTPLENEIIYSLGGGHSLNKQFYLYKQYELNVTNGGEKGEEKLKWLIETSKGKRNLYICFWNSDFKSYLVDMEYFKRLNLTYKNNITFVLVSLENDDAKWNQLVTNYNFFSDGMINYRIGSSAELEKTFKVKKTPTFIVVTKNGELTEAKHPSDPLLEKDFKFLLEHEKGE